MTGPVELRIRLEPDNDSRYEISVGGFSDVEDLAREVKEKVEADEWNSYIVTVEKSVSDDDWESVASVGGTVTDYGYEGCYSSLDEISSEKVRDAVRDVWEEALMTLRENAVVPSASWPLGRAVGAVTSDYDLPISVLGHLRKSEAGHSVLNVGYMAKNTDSAYHSPIPSVVLTPAERERLIADLIAHRE